MQGNFNPTHSSWFQQLLNHVCHHDGTTSWMSHDWNVLQKIDMKKSTCPRQDSNLGPFSQVRLRVVSIRCFPFLFCSFISSGVFLLLHIVCWSLTHVVAKKNYYRLCMILFAIQKSSSFDIVNKKNLISWLLFILFQINFVQDRLKMWSCILLQINFVQDQLKMFPT